MISKADQAKALLSVLLDLRELELTHQIVMPLLHCFGYDKVEYYGGPAEEGKDIVCWGIDELGEIRLGVAQVKRFKPSRRAADTKSFSGVVTQLSQSLEKSLPYIDGKSYKPSVVYFITPYSVDTAALKMRFEHFESLRDRQVKIIDGQRLSGLVQARLPKLVTKLLGSRSQLANALAPLLTNEELLSALEFPERRSVESFYTDIDFSMGHPATKIFFLSNFLPQRLRVKLSSEEWEPVRAVQEIALAEVGCGLLGEDLSEVESAYQEKARRYEEWHSVYEKALKELDQGKSRLTELKKESEKKAFELRKRDPKLHDRHEQVEMSKKRILALVLKRESEDSESLRAEIIRLEKSLEESEEEIDKSDHILRPAQRRENAKIAEIRKQSKYVQEIVGCRPECVYEVTLDGHALAEHLMELRHWVERGILGFNRKEPRLEDLRTFLERCHKIFSTVKRLLVVPEVGKAIGIGIAGALRFDEPISRLELSVHRIFDTGLNITVLGEAGAGKTTSLQMYTYGKLVGTTDARFVMFAPLSRVVRAWEQVRRESESEFFLEEALRSFLASRGVEVQQDRFVSELEENGGIVLVDGLDEVVKGMPGMIAEIKRFSTRYPAVQVIVSSRVSSEGSEGLPFLAVTLLPFTDRQRSKFVEKWLGPEKKSLATMVLDHLREHSDLAEIVRNPLLATIICVLAESSVSLPASEIRLYDERMRLLLGNYDIHKQVKRISTHSEQLKVLSQKLAFRLHRQVKRFEERLKLYEWAEEIFLEEMTPEGCRCAVDELIDPCNVLLPMAEGNKFGFGHLRFQEFLAARELTTNRGIEILLFLKQDWWTGALLLFSQMSDGIGWLLRALSSLGEIDGHREKLLQMIEAGPRKQRMGLRKILLERIRFD